MKAWAAVVVVLAWVGTILNLLMGTSARLLLHNGILFLVALGILVRIRFETKEGDNMKPWAAVVLVLASIGTILNLLMWAPQGLLLHNAILFLIALGILVRIRFQTKGGGKRNLQPIIDESTAN